MTEGEVGGNEGVNVHCWGVLNVGWDGAAWQPVAAQEFPKTCRVVPAH